MVSSMTWDEEFDFVCVGSGGAGMAGAAAAAVHGARVLLIEKTDLLGGLTAFSEGEIWVPANFVQKREGVEDSLDEALTYLAFLSAGLGDADLREHFTVKMNEAIEFFEDHAGFALSIMPNRTDYFEGQATGAKGPGRYLEVGPFDTRQLGAFEPLLILSPYTSSRLTQTDIAAVNGGRDEAAPDNMKAELVDLVAQRTADHLVCGGAGVVARLMDTALRHGAQIRTNVKVERLIGEDNRILGVEVSTPEGPRRIRAQAVLLATGGYDWNPDLVRLYEQRADLYTVTTPNQTGDHMVMAGDVGAAIAMRNPVFTPLLNGTRVPHPEAPGDMFSMPLFAGRPHMIFVNREGRRFADESFHPGMHAAQAQFDGLTMSTPNLPTFFVFDQTYRDKYGIGPFGHDGAIPESVAVQGDSLAELATRAGIDRGNLTATVERFNAFCEQGRDDDFGRGSRPWGKISIGDYTMPNPLLGPLEKGPYYAIRLVQMTAGVPSAGLKIDGAARVINTRGLPIAGLYAAGNAAGVVDTIGYQSGMSISRGITHGYLAGCDVAASLGK